MLQQCIWNDLISEYMKEWKAGLSSRRKAEPKSTSCQNKIKIQQRLISVWINWKLLGSRWKDLRLTAGLEGDRERRRKHGEGERINSLKIQEILSCSRALENSNSYEVKAGQKTQGQEIKATFLPAHGFPHCWDYSTYDKHISKTHKKGNTGHSLKGEISHSWWLDEPHGLCL